MDQNDRKMDSVSELKNVPDIEANAIPNLMNGFGMQKR
jgi:hypothetical protein